VVNALITTPFSATNWFGQAVAAAAATVITLPYTTVVGVLLYLDLRARKETLSLDTPHGGPTSISRMTTPASAGPENLCE
jgi:hypothetical protein